MGIVGLSMLITINILWMPRLGDLLQEPVKKAAIFAKKNDFKNMVIFNHYNPSFHFYSELYAEERKPENGEIVFTKTDRLRGIPVGEVFYSKYGYALIKVGRK